MIGLAPWPLPLPPMALAVRFPLLGSFAQFEVGEGWGAGGPGLPSALPDSAALSPLPPPVLFHMYDSDSDGRITLEEYRNVKYAPAPVGPQRLPCPAAGMEARGHGVSAPPAGGRGAALRKPPHREGVCALHRRRGHDGGGQRLRGADGESCRVRAPRSPLPLPLPTPPCRAPVLVCFWKAPAGRDCACPARRSNRAWRRPLLRGLSLLSCPPRRLARRPNPRGVGPSRGVWALGAVDPTM